MNRIADVIRFYSLLDQLEARLGGSKTLSSFGDYTGFPKRGLYFFFEPQEVRRESGEGPRIVRVGTHALTATSKSTLGQRLRQHRGHGSGGGNHRGSIFRLLIGHALLARGGLTQSRSWGVGSDAGKAAATLGLGRDELGVAEAEIEKAVTDYIGTMPFLWVDISDAPGRDSLRGSIERNSIALLSNHLRVPVDCPSSGWLGKFSDRPLVRSSGLWNQRHVAETHDPAFLDILDDLIQRTNGRLD